MKVVRIGRQPGLKDTDDYRLQSPESRAITRQNVSRLVAQGWSVSAIGKGLRLAASVVQRIIDEQGESDG